MHLEKQYRLRKQAEFSARQFCRDEKDFAVHACNACRGLGAMSQPHVTAATLHTLHEHAFPPTHHRWYRSGGATRFTADACNDRNVMKVFSADDALRG